MLPSIMIRINMRHYSSRLVGALLLIAFSSQAISMDRQDSQPSLCFDGRGSVCEVALATAIGRAGEYDGTKVMVVGYLAEFRNELRLYLSEDARLVGDVASSVLVTGIDAETASQLGRQAESYVRVTGFVRTLKDRDWDRTSIVVERAFTLMRPANRDRVRAIQRESELKL